MRTTFKAILVAMCVLLPVTSAFTGQEEKSADLVFKNGRVYTVNPAQPWAEAVAIRGNTIVHVGSNKEMVDWIGTKTRVVDLQGRMLMPGFIDGHNHFVSGAAGKRGIKLVGSKNTPEMLQRIRDYIKANPGKEAYQGFGWEFLMFGEKDGTRQQLDSICADKPVVLFNEDMHNVWFNTRAMQGAGITKDTPDPVPGASYYKRGPDGTPSGIAIEPESWQKIAVANGVFGGKEMLKAIADEVFPMIPKMGITAYHDMGIWAPDLPQGYLGFELLMEMEKAGTLPCRVVGVYGIRDGNASPDQHIAVLKEWSAKYRSDLVQVTGLKIWADGTFLAHTGVELGPYADKPDTRGDSSWTADALNRWVETAYKNGFDVMIHTDGDLAIRRSLDAAERASKKAVASPARLTSLQHLATIHPDDLPRFKTLGVGGNMTPVWLVNYKRQYEEAIRILGREKVGKEYALAKALMESGANVTFGADIPGTDLEENPPLFQIQAAVTGYVPGDVTTVAPPASRLPSLAQMLYGYTIAGARQMRLEAKTGSIETGKRADLIVLEKNLFDIPPKNLSQVKVLLTMMDGRVRYGAKEMPAF
ncbi:MAG: amidohydrolase [Myxococcota bacterium]